MPPSLAELDIHSQRDADELERELGIRFDDFTPEDADTWIRQNAYLNQYSENRLVTIAADAADVAVRTVRQWQFEDVLGFNRRLGIAVLYYTDMLESMLLKRVQEPGSPPSLLTMLLRAQMPEKYGSVRRSGPPRDNNDGSHHGDHDPQLPPIPQPDHDLLQGIFQDLQNLKQFAGLPEPDFTPPQPDPTPSPSAPSAPSVVNPSPQNLAPNTQNPSPSLSVPSVPSVVNPSSQNPTPNTQNPSLSRSQRRQLQRKQRKLQKTNRTRAPT